MADKIKTVRLDVKDQPCGSLYDMSLRFVGNALPSDLNNLLAHCGMSEKLQIEKAVTLRITQTVPFIPDDKTIRNYAELLEASQNNSKTSVKIVNLVFDGYDYLYAVRPADTEPSDRPAIQLPDLPPEDNSSYEPKSNKKE